VSGEPGSGEGSAATNVDNLQWMEEAEGQRALDWARRHTARSIDRLTQDERYKRYFATALDIGQDRNRIPAATPFDGWRYGDQIYDLLADEAHPRGLLRRTSPASFETATPDWNPVLDIDALAGRERRNWQLRQLDCVGPKYRRCIIGLSEGGQDAIVYREYDLENRAFVADGFALPEPMQGATVAWGDEETLFVATRFHGSALSPVGFPLSVRRWSRGTTIDGAREVYRGRATSLLVSVRTYVEDGGRNTLILDEMDAAGRSVLATVDETGTAVRLNLPSSYTALALVAGQWVVALRENWSIGGKTWNAGSVVAVARSEASESAPNVRLLLDSEPRASTFGIVPLRRGVLVFQFKNVQARLTHVAFENGRWTARRVAVPDGGILQPGMIAEPATDSPYVRYESFLQPMTLYKVDVTTGRLAAVKHLPAQFDASRFVAKQLEARSADGTSIPYFVVMPRSTKESGGAPALLYGYGAHGASQHPAYSGVLGKLWLEQGGIYAVAIIRGGGEFGEEWHQAATRTNKQRSYDDFLAVANDLTSRGITSPRRLGLRGMSSGGLLMGVMLTQHPDLFSAVVMEVPVLDLFRGDLLQGGQAGAAIEYGSPDVSDERQFLERTSPYQNLRVRPGMPVPLIITSAKDDRVHPAQARRFAAKMESLGLPFLYYETAEGGHAAATGPIDRAKLDAAIFTYLAQRLMQ
jgi:prolyl oligopeptidase